MIFEFIEAEKASFPVAAMCSTLGVSRSGFYDWRSRPPSRRQKRREELAVKVAAAYKRSDGRYGSPRIHAQLCKGGEVVSEKTVASIMQENDIVARHKRKYKATTDSRHTARIAPNVLNRNFVADRPNQVWVTDVKAIWTLTRWCYLAAICDLFSRRVVGWAMSESNDTALAIAALEEAIERRQPAPGLLHHSDRGSPYGSDDYIAVLDAHGILRSMSRTGDCWDNAVAESLNATFEYECLRERTFVNFEDARAVVGDYIENFYNPERLHSTLDFMSPIEFELRSALLQEAA